MLGASWRKTLLESNNRWASKARLPFQTHPRLTTWLSRKRIRTLQEAASRNSLQKHNSTSLLPSEFSWRESLRKMRQAQIMSKKAPCRWMNLPHVAPKRGRKSTPSSTRESTSLKRRSLLSLKMLRPNQTRSQSVRLQPHCKTSSSNQFWKLSHRMNGLNRRYPAQTMQSPSSHSCSTRSSKVWATKRLTSAFPTH